MAGCRNACCAIQDQDVYSTPLTSASSTAFNGLTTIELRTSPTVTTSMGNHVDGKRGKDHVLLILVFRSPLDTIPIDKFVYAALADKYHDLSWVEK